MSDQASQLRHLVLRATRLREAELHPAPRILVVCSARKGVGTTSVAASLSRTLVEQGARVVAVDADCQPGALALACGVTELPNYFSPATARSDIHEALVRAPGGLQVVPGVWDSDCPRSEQGAQELLKQFHTLGRHAEWLVLDLGDCSSGIPRSWRDSAEHFLLVATPANAVVMETYSLIKKSLVARAGNGVALVVNQIAEERLASDVLARVDRSCQRFLGFGIGLAGSVASGGDFAAALAPWINRLCDPHETRNPRRIA